MDLEQNTTTEHDEKKLFSKIKKKRDRDDFIKAYDMYADQIYRFIYFKVSNEENAQDLTSAVFLKTWNYIQNNSLKDFKTFKALIYKIARTTIIDYYRSSKESISIEAEEIDVEDVAQDIHKDIEVSSEFGMIQDKLQELKDEYREIIILKYIEELSVQEIAKIIDKSKGNVRVLVHRALKALKELIEADNQNVK